MESFILDYQNDLYGKPVRLSFLRRIREEKKFASVDQLVAQMAADVASARAVFDELRLTGEASVSG